MSKLKSTGYLIHSVQKISGCLYSHKSKVLHLSLQVFCGGKVESFPFGKLNLGEASAFLSVLSTANVFTVLSALALTWS